MTIIGCTESMSLSPPDFELTPALDDPIVQAAIVVTASRHVVARTGAGLTQGAST